MKKINISKKAFISPVQTQIFNQDFLLFSLSFVLWEEALVEMDKRRKLIKQLKTVFIFFFKEGLGVNEIIKEKKMNFDHLAILYNNLSDFITRDKHNRRIILYLPIELLPEKFLVVKNKKLKEALSNFLITYLKTWEDLLTDHDFRTCFNDGDIDEQKLELESLEEIVKAAHLIPFLFWKRLITLPQIASLYRNTEDEILKKTIKETMKKFLSAKQKAKENYSVGVDWVDVFFSRVEEDLLNIENNFSETRDSVPSARRKWLRKNNIEKLIKKYASQITCRFKKNLISFNEIKSFINSSETQFEHRLSIGIIAQIIETQFFINSTRAQEIYFEFSGYLESLRASDDSTIAEDLESLDSHLQFLGIVESLTNKPFNPSSFINQDLNIVDKKHVQTLLELIEQDEFLSKNIYPIINLYGSKAKGYASRNTDYDMAVFFRPGAKFQDREEARGRFNEIFSKLNINASFLEFWLEEEDTKLQIIDYSTKENYLANESYIHVLFEGFWCGCRESIREIFSKLITPYMIRESSGGHSDAMRTFIRIELERSFLQCRLMQKSHHFLFPDLSQLFLDLSKLIDTEGAFYDKAYRALATELFLSKVYIPKV